MVFNHFPWCIFFLVDANKTHCVQSVLFCVKTYFVCIFFIVLGIYDFVESTKHAFCYVFSSFFFIWMYSEIFVVFAFFFHLFTKCKRKAFTNKKKRLAGNCLSKFLSYKIPAKVIRDKVVFSLIDMWL